MPSQTTLADVAAKYVLDHRIERQSRSLDSAHPVELTVVQNMWAQATGREKQNYIDAPNTVMRALETSKRGHELFDRVRDGRVVAYGLRSIRPDVEGGA